MSHLQAWWNVIVGNSSLLLHISHSNEPWKFKAIGIFKIGFECFNYEIYGYKMSEVIKESMVLTITIVVIIL